MIPLHIGIDLDNTILDATSTHLHYYNKASGSAFTPEDMNDFYLYRLYGWDEAERKAIYEAHGHDIHWNSLPLPMAVEVLRISLQSPYKPSSRSRGSPAPNPAWTCRPG